MGAVPSSAVRSIKKAQKTVTWLLINTGRVYGNITPIITDIGFDGYVCGCGTML
jgi:hydroxymethylpyrimidine pyrophosphatase-like HAD family hydrolase